MSAIERQLRPQLLDAFSHELLTGALQVAGDQNNPVRHSQFASSMRALFDHTLHALAPDGNVPQCSWYAQQPGTNGPTRRQRAKYATQGGLSDAYVAQIGIDVKDIHDEALEAIQEMNKYTHVQVDTLVQDQAAIDLFVDDAMGALINLFSSFEHCRATVINALAEKIDWETTQALASDAIGEVDILATHYSIEGAYVEDIAISDITNDSIRFKAIGTLVVELQWGSDSDLERGDGATSSQSFPFQVSMEAPVTDVTAFHSVGYTVDTGDWFGDGDDDDDVD